MDTKRCKLFLTVVETGSMAGAAAKTGYTPSGIVRAVKALEGDLGFSLLYRNTRGIELTEEGKLVFPQLKELVYQSERVENLSDKIKGLETGEISVGTYFSTAANWLPPVIRSFQETYRHIRIHLEEGGNRELYTWLGERKIDCAISSYRNFKGDWIPLRRDELIFWLSRGHEKAEAGSIPLADMVEEAYVHTLPGLDTDTEFLFASEDIKIKPRYTSVDNYTTYRMVEAGLGFAVNNRLMAENWNGNVAVVSMDPPHYIELGIAVPSLADASTVTKKFIDYVKEGVAQGL